MFLTPNQGRDNFPAASGSITGPVYITDHCDPDMGKVVCSDKKAAELGRSGSGRYCLAPVMESYTYGFFHGFTEFSHSSFPYS